MPKTREQTRAELLEAIQKFADDQGFLEGSGVGGQADRGDVEYRLDELLDRAFGPTRGAPND